MASFYFYVALKTMSHSTHDRWFFIMVRDALVMSLVFWLKCLLPSCSIIVPIIQINATDNKII